MLLLLKTHSLSGLLSWSIVGILRGFGIKIVGPVERGFDFERGVLTVSCSMNYHEDKMYNTGIEGIFVDIQYI